VSDSNCICSGVSACAEATSALTSPRSRATSARKASSCQPPRTTAGPGDQLDEVGVSPEMPAFPRLHPAPWPDLGGYHGTEHKPAQVRAAVEHGLQQRKIALDLLQLLLVLGSSTARQHSAPPCSPSWDRRSTRDRSRPGTNGKPVCVASAGPVKKRLRSMPPASLLAPRIPCAAGHINRGIVWNAAWKEARRRGSVQLCPPSPHDSASRSAIARRSIAWPRSRARSS